MALSDCTQCWMTPCECGNEYIFYAQEGRERLTKAINGFTLEQMLVFLEKENMLTVDHDTAFKAVKNHFKYKS